MDVGILWPHRRDHRDDCITKISPKSARTRKGACFVKMNLFGVIPSVAQQREVAAIGSPWARLRAVTKPWGDDKGSPTSPALALAFGGGETRIQGGYDVLI